MKTTVLIILAAASWQWYQRDFAHAAATVAAMATFCLWYALLERRPRVAMVIAIAVTLPVVALILLGLFFGGAR